MLIFVLNGECFHRKPATIETVIKVLFDKREIVWGKKQIQKDTIQYLLIQLIAADIIEYDLTI